MIHGLDLEDTTRPPLARLNSGGVPIVAGQVHKVWRGLVQVPGSMEPGVPVALKWMAGAHKLPIELACALAGSELALAVPRGLVVLATREQLPGLPAGARPVPGTDEYLCFGSQLQWPDDSSARLIGDDAAAEEHTWRQLCSTPAAAPGAAWDELAANADRHVGNLLFDGSKYWFIDHDLALEPIAKVMRTWAVQAARQSVIDHRAKINTVAEQLKRRRPNDHGMLAQPARFSRAQARINLVADQVRNWSTGQAQVDAVWPLTEVVLRGIATRLPPLALMLSERLHIPDAKALWSSSSQSLPKPPRQ
jgi:hypothetical protein